MVREQNLFQILKFSSSFICQNNLNIENYTSKQAIQDGNVVSVGDNIAFSQIRKLRGDAREDKEIFNSVSLLRLALRRAKRDGNQKAARAIARAIYGTLFVKDIISVESTKKSEYRRVAKAGFYVNGIRYVRFSASAGQIRHNTVLFVAADIYQQLYKILMCGLDEKITEINIAKLSAYFSLSTSSVLWVTKPRVCIIKDFETTIPQQKIDWICNAEDGSKYVEERSVDVALNSCDGQGLISPDMAAQWSQEMGLDYVSSSYVVRSIFVKGNLVPFDFRQYAHENGISTIKDRWGKEYNVDEVDVLLSESQFKMYKYYSSWEEYDAHVRENGIKWGVARYNRKYDDEWCLINYQYIQVLNMKDEDIEELIQPTIDWLNKVCTGDDLYALLYSLGGFNSDQDISYNDVYTRAQNLAMRAVIKDPAYLKDSYVQKKIYRNIVESINKAKLGKIWARGNYQFMISDPISQCRSAIGLDPTGEIPADNVYCNFWNTRTESDSIALARSPCLDKHEINVCKLYTSENTDKWYKYIKSGVIYSIYDTSVCRHSDSDFD